MNAPQLLEISFKPRHAHLIAPERVKDFVTGGKSTFTVLNTTSGNRGTFRVEKSTDFDKDFEVWAFTGSDNSLKSSYTLFGWVRKDGSFSRYTPVAEYMSLLSEVQCKDPNSWLMGFLDSWAGVQKRGVQPTPRMEERYQKSLRKYGVPVCLPASPKGLLLEKMFVWTWNKVHKGLLPAEIEVWHEGACCYCGRKLTVPASIELGIGPDCAEERGLYPLWQALNGKAAA